MTCDICHRVPESSCGDLTCKWHLQWHAPGCSIGDREKMMRPGVSPDFERDTHCSYCSHRLSLKRKFPFIGQPQPDHSRPIVFGGYACSGRCEIALSDELDNMEDGEYHKKIEERWSLMPNLPRAQYLKECKQRGVKP